jgi:hypothetical protein
VDGESRRVELAGSGSQLYNAMLDLAKHLPKNGLSSVLLVKFPIIWIMKMIGMNILQ